MVEYSLFWAGLFDRNIPRKGCNLPGMPPDRPAPKETVLHYYPHHIGDFIKETARLTDHQVITYLRLIWIYYESECPLHDDLSVLAMQVGSDEQTISLILRAYFSYQDGKWYQMRCESEIRKYQKKSVSAKAANKARWSNSDMKSDKKSDADNKQNQIATNNQEPRTNNHSNKRKSAFVPPISKELLEDWMQVRKNKKAGPVTKTAWAGIEREAAKANITVEQAIRVCCERGWQSFKADWNWQGSIGVESKNAKPWYISKWSEIVEKGKEVGIVETRELYGPDLKAAIFSNYGITQEMVRKAMIDWEDK